MEEIRVKLEEAVQGVFDGVDLGGFEVEVTVAPEAAGADYASNVAMRLAGKVGRAPREVAAELAEVLQDEGLEVDIAGPGFLNFILSNEYYSDKLTEIDENLADLGKNIPQNEYDENGNITQSEYLNKTVVAEFSDPNPFKVLHVGHLYTSIVGDAMARMMEFAGAKVIRANFGGDVGLHVAKTMYALLSLDSSALADARLTLRTSSTVRSDAPAVLNSSNESNAKSDAEKAAILLGECYVEGTRAYEDDVDAHAEITRLNKILFEISAAGSEAKFEGEKAKIAEIYWWGREASYRYFDEFYARVGVKFDKYYPESTVAERGLAKVREELKAGVYEMSDGAVIFPGEKYDLHTRVFINKEGLPTYEAKDVGLIFQKWDDWKFDKSIVITGNEQSEYMKVVLKSVEQYAPELVERTVHLTHGMVRLPGDAKMSSRLGNFVRAVDVLNTVTVLLGHSSASADALLSRRTSSTPPSVAPASLNSTPNNDRDKIVIGAVKYAFLKSRVGGNIIFDAEESVSMSGNSGPYLQYSCVRAKRILSKISVGEIKIGDEERDLAKKIVQYPGALVEVMGELAPHKLCNYLYELAQEFSRFYEKVAVVGSKHEAERGRLVQIYSDVMVQGLGLLGIEVPEEM